jgi:hypothetical protein
VVDAANMNASFPASSMPATQDTPQNYMKTVTEAIRASSISTVVAKRRVIKQFDGRNTNIVI